MLLYFNCMFLTVLKAAFMAKLPCTSQTQWWQSPHCLYNRQMLKLLPILLLIAYKLYHDSDCDWCYIAHI